MKKKILAFLKNETAPKNWFLKFVYTIGKGIYAVYGSIRRFHLSDIPWSINQYVRRVRLALTPKARLEEIKERMRSRGPIDGCQISLIFGSRQLGNKDNSLDKFLKSFVDMTENLERVEILMKLDEDDDLLFFDKIIQKYKINLRPFITHRGNGYIDIYIWYSDGFKRRSPSSRLFLLVSDDAEFIYKNWDTKLCSLLPSHDFFIGTSFSFEDTFKVFTRPDSPVPWHAGDDFPIFGTGILQRTQRIAEKYEGWLCFGNSSHIDGLSGDLLKRLWKRHKLNLHVRVPVLLKLRGKLTWSSSRSRTNMRTEMLRKFFTEESQRIHDEMVDEIHRSYINRDDNLSNQVAVKS